VPDFGGLAEFEGMAVKTRIAVERSAGRVIFREKRKICLTSLPLATYYLSNNHNDESDEKHGASNHICFRWNTAC
jgi:hypothetical protein